MDRLSAELGECEDQASWDPWQDARNPTGWGLTIRGPAAPERAMRGLEIWMEWAGSTLIVRYASRSLTALSVERLACHFLTALREILTYPDRPLAALEVLDESDTRRLVEDYNRNLTPCSNNKPQSIPMRLRWSIARTENGAGRTAS